MYLLSNKLNWFHYAPFLYFQGLNKNRRVLIKDIFGLPHLFLWTKKENESRESIRLLFFHPHASKDHVYKIIELLKEMNNGEQAFVSFISEDDLIKINGFFGKDSIRMEIDIIGREYVYQKEKIIQLQGKNFRDLKKKIIRYKRKYIETVFRPFQVGDSTSIQKLYSKWLCSQSPKYPILFDNYYTQNVIKMIDDVYRLNIQVMIAEIKGVVAGFIMGGRLNDLYSNAFIMKTDTKSLLGENISYILKYEFFKQLDTEFINDGVDFGFKGLRQSKRHFCPVDLLRVFRGRFYY